MKNVIITLAIYFIFLYLGVSFYHGTWDIMSLGQELRGQILGVGLFWAGIMSLLSLAYTEESRNKND